MKRLFALFGALWMIFVSVPVCAAESDQSDLHSMFEKRNEMDEGQIEGYYYELNALFDADAAAFLEALSKEEEQTARELAFPLAVEHQSEETAAAYQNALNSSKEKSAAILKHGVLIFTATNMGIDEDVFGKKCYLEMQAAYNEDHRLFLLSAAEFTMSDSIMEVLSEGMTRELDKDALIALDKCLSEDANAAWADEDVKAVIRLIQVKVDERLTSPETGDIDIAAVGVCMVTSLGLIWLLMDRKRFMV